jgi:hypothetical protein
MGWISSEISELAVFLPTLGLFPAQSDFCGGFSCPVPCFLPKFGTLLGGILAP